MLAGECLLLVEGEERQLRAWDFVHCPPGTEHIFVGAGEAPCVIFMTGARSTGRTIVYPRSEVALRARRGRGDGDERARRGVRSVCALEARPAGGVARLPWA